MTLDEATSTVEMWPDVELSASVFMAMSTQWMVGPNGRTGMNYASLAEVWRRLKVPPLERDEVFDDLRVMEIAALEQMHKE